MTSIERMMPEVIATSRAAARCDGLGGDAAALGAGAGCCATAAPSGSASALTSAARMTAGRRNIDMRGTPGVRARSDPTELDEAGLGREDRARGEAQEQSVL